MVIETAVFNVEGEDEDLGTREWSETARNGSFIGKDTVWKLCIICKCDIFVNDIMCFISIAVEFFITNSLNEKGVESNNWLSNL